jgi:Lon protease-like protein
MPVGRETITLPLFLVDAVLFPGTRLALTVQEERHRRVVQECADHDTPLGILLARHHDNGPAEPASVGTIARVLEAGPAGNGLSLTVAGISRFSLLSYRQGSRVLIGQGRFLPDVDDPPGRALTDECYALASEYVSLAELEASPREVPVDPEALSYWVAQWLPVDVDARQELLEQRSLAHRLAAEVGHLRDLVDRARTPRWR